MPTLKENVGNVLNEFNDNTPNCFPCVRTDCDNCVEMNQSVDSATSAIKELFLEWVGENLSLVNPPHGNIEWLKGYNQRGEEIRRKIK